MNLIGSDNDANLLAAYHFAKVKTLATTHTLISVIEIPLIEKKRFEHTRIFALPFKHDEKSIAPVIKHEHIWQNEKYVKLFSDFEIRQCINFNEETYCTLKSPLQLESKTNACEMRI